MPVKLKKKKEKMQLNRTFSLFLLFFLSLSLVLTGCKKTGSGKKTKTSEVQTEEKNKNTEEDSKYKYLIKTTISSDGVSVTTYVPGEPETQTEENPTKGELYGISADCSIETGDLNGIISKKAESICNDLKANGYKKIKKGDIQKTSEKGLCSISYSVIADKKEYPCRDIIYAKTISDSAYLLADIAIDNTMADTESKEVLSELLEAYGLTSGSDRDTTEKTEKTEKAEETEKTETEENTEENETDQNSQNSQKNNQNSDSSDSSENPAESDDKNTEKSTDKNSENAKNSENSKNNKKAEKTSNKKSSDKNNKNSKNNGKINKNSNQTGSIGLDPFSNRDTRSSEQSIENF